MDFKTILESIYSLYETFRKDWKFFSDKTIGAIEANTRALEEKEITEEVSLTNTEDIVEPLVQAQNKTTEAIKAIPKVEVPVTNIKPLEDKIERLTTILEKKDLSVKIGDTKVDVKGIIKELKELPKKMPKFEEKEQKDYTELLDRMCQAMEKPDHSHMIKMHEMLKNLGTSADLEALAAWLKVIAEKEAPEFPDFPRDKNGIPYFTPTKIGGGGSSGLTAIQESLLQNISDTVATEETQIAVNPIDDISGARPVLTSNHWEIHNGHHYIVSGQTTLASAANQDFLITVPSGMYNHFLYKVRVTGEASVTLYESPTVSANGTPQTSVNRNRQSLNTAVTTVNSNPTVTGVGTFLRTEHIGNGQTVGGDGRDENEWILKAGTYLLRITSEAATNDTSWTLDWYEN